MRPESIKNKQGFNRVFDKGKRYHGELLTAVDGILVHGDSSLLAREVMDVMVAGMTAEHVLERLREGAAVITPGDRSDVVLAVASAHAAEGFPTLSTIILNGGLPLHREIARLVTGVGLRLPMIATELGTFAAASAVANARGRVTADSGSKIDTALQLMDRHVDIGDMLERLAIAIPTVTTPQMFAYQLMERARGDRKRIVLPEGDDDRILQAAGRLLRRGIAGLTILGEESQVRARAAELGVDLSGATVINPRTSELREKFAEQYAEIRKKKGVTLEQARDVIEDGIDGQHALGPFLDECRLLGGDLSHRAAVFGGKPGVADRPYAQIDACLFGE